MEEARFANIFQAAQIMVTKQSLIMELFKGLGWLSHDSLDVTLFQKVALIQCPDSIYPYVAKGAYSLDSFPV